MKYNPRSRWAALFWAIVFCIWLVAYLSNFLLTLDIAVGLIIFCSGVIPLMGLAYALFGVWGMAISIVAFLGWLVLRN